MKASIEQVTPVKKRLTVEVEAEEVNRKIEEAYKDLKKRAKVDGFRPGKCLATSCKGITGTS